MRLPDGVRRRLNLDALKDVDAELDEELAFHFEETVRALRAGGMDEEAARCEARRRFGNERAYRRALREIDGRRGTDTGGEGMDVMTRNLRFALRGIRRSPGFAAAVVLILGLGIGANAVMFGVVDRLLLSPPQHVRDADAVRHLYVERTFFNGTRNPSRSMTWPDYVDLRSVDGFAQVAAYTSARDETMGRGTEAERLRTIGASPELFPLLGVRPELGRFFVQDDDELGANPVAVLAHEFWERRFGSDPGILGRRLDIGPARYEVVGVAPEGFTGAELEPVDVWLPLVRTQELRTGSTNWQDSRSWWWLRAVARLEEGTDVSVADAQATAAHRAGRAELIASDRYDEEAEIIAAPVIAARGPDPGAETRVAQWLAGVSAVVLLIACFNVANLLLGRAMRWRRELAVRMALGVSRSRLLGQLLTESLVLAGLGAVAAVAIAYWGGSAIHDVLLPNVAFTDAGLDLRLGGFLLAATLLTTLLAGLLPALQASRGEVADTLRSGGRGVSDGVGRARVALLVGQAALSVVLLIGAGLFVTSLRSARTVDLGYDADRLLYVNLEWQGEVDAATQRRIFEDVRERVVALPDVAAAGLGYTMPFFSSIVLGEPRIPGLDSFPSHPSGGPYMNKVGAGYFEAMGLEIVDGRPIEASDLGEGAPPVAVVSESLASAGWGGASPVGQCMVLRPNDGESPCTTVIGVVENFNRQALVEENPHHHYLVNLDHPEVNGSPQVLMVRAAGDPRDLVQPVRQAVAGVSPSIRFPIVTSFDERLERDLRSWTLGASMFTVFGLLALVVAALGLYSVLAFDVASRRTELGIRSALGAGSDRLVRMVLRRAVGFVTAGVLVGVVVALAVARWVEPLLFGVSATSPVVYGGVVVTLLVVAALAGLLPAWRVAHTDPRVALQAE